MNFFNRLDISIVWESIKTPVRQLLLVLYSLLLNKLFVYLANVVGFPLTVEQQATLLSYGTPLVWGIISVVDNVLHRLGKKTGSLRLTHGLTPYLEVIKAK